MRENLVSRFAIVGFLLSLALVDCEAYVLFHGAAAGAATTAVAAAATTTTTTTTTATPTTTDAVGRRHKSRDAFIRGLYVVGPDAEACVDNNSDVAIRIRPHLVFPGGGLYFYWQAGVITYLREQGYDLSKATMAGASAGALTATLTATNVDFYQATKVALRLSTELGVWDRSEGLQGVWGQSIYDWLEELLPPNAMQLAQESQLTLLVTRLPTFQKEKVHHFVDRNDLIKCNMASVHIPWFLDGKLTTNFRDMVCMDGSFLQGQNDLAPKEEEQPVLVLDHKQDPKFKNKTLLDAVSLLSPDGVRDLLESGKKYAGVMEEKGMFHPFPKI